MASVDSPESREGERAEVKEVPVNHHKSDLTRRKALGRTRLKSMYKVMHRLRGRMGC